MTQCPCCDRDIPDMARSRPSCGTILAPDYRPPETTVESDRPSRQLYLQAKETLETRILKYPGRYIPFSLKCVDHDSIVNVLDYYDVEGLLIQSIAGERNLRLLDPLKIDKNVAAAYDEIGFCRRLRHDFHRAEHYYRKGLEILDGYNYLRDDEVLAPLSRLLHDLAEALYLQARFEEAEQVLIRRLGTLQHAHHRDAIGQTVSLTWTVEKNRLIHEIYQQLSLWHNDSSVHIAQGHVLSGPSRSFTPTLSVFQGPKEVRALPGGYGELGHPSFAVSVFADTQERERGMGIQTIAISLRGGHLSSRRGA
ncbi:MAG: tetratricopeptide repeat protein [Candidatus Binatia bacterium]